MTHKITRLSEGVTLTAVFGEKSKSQSLLVNMTLPLNAENATNTSLLYKVMLRGSARYPSVKELCAVCEDNYSCSIDVNQSKTGEMLTLSFGLSCLKNEYAINGEDILKKGIELLGEFIFDPYFVNGEFDAKYLEREKSSLREQMLAVVNNKPRYALRRAVSLMCEGEAYSIQSGGEMAFIDGVTTASLTKFYFDLMNNAVVNIIFAGNYGEDPLCNAVKEYLTFAPRPSSLPETKYVNRADKVRSFSEDADTEQSTLVMGFRIGGEPWKEISPALTLFSDIFSQSPISKLFMNVREKKSLCYYCTSSLDRRKGVMFVTSGIDEKKSKKVRDAVLAELDNVKNGVISNEEFESAVSSVINACKAVTDDTSQICSYYGTKILQENVVSPEEYIKEIEKVTLDDVVNVAKGITLDTVFLLKGTKI